MKPYKRVFTEENALSELTDVKIIDKIFEFIKENPFPKDHEQFHAWAEEQGFKEADILEQYVYAILTVFITGGKSKGELQNNAQVKKGIEVEKEHVAIENNDNKVVAYISELLAQKIATDHIIEFENYYDALDEMETKLKEEK